MLPEPAFSPKVPMPRDLRIRVRISLKRFLMRPAVHGFLGFAITGWLFRLFHLEVL